MPDQFDSPSNNRRKQLRQFDQCSSTFTCPRCVSDIRTCHFYSNSCSAIHELQGTSPDTYNSMIHEGQTAGCDIVECRGTGRDAVSDISTRTDDNEFPSETWVSSTKATTRCTKPVTAKTVTPVPTVPISLTNRVRVVSASADPKHPNEGARDAESERCTTFHKVPSRRSLSVSRRSRRQTPKSRSWSHNPSSSVKLERNKSMEEVPSPEVALRSGPNESRTRRTSSRIEEHDSQTSYNGVRTRRGVKGFLVEIRPPKWKRTIWLGTYATAVEAAAAHDAGVFYTDKPKKKYNFYSPAISFPPLPSNLDRRTSSPKVMEAFKAFVKEQATLASKTVKNGNWPADQHLAISFSPVLALPDSEVEPMNVNDDVPEHSASALELGPNCESEFSLVSPLPALTSTLEMELELANGVPPQCYLPMEYPIWSLDSWPQGGFEFPAFVTSTLQQDQDPLAELLQLK